MDLFAPRLDATALIRMLSQSIPARARGSDPQTSRDAAATWGEHKLTSVQAVVLSFFLAKGRGSDGEMEEWVGRTYPKMRFGMSSLRKRRGDLVEKGVLRDSGSKDDERHMIIWEVVNG